MYLAGLEQFLFAPFELFHEAGTELPRVFPVELVIFNQEPFEVLWTSQFIGK